MYSLIWKIQERYSIVLILIFCNCISYQSAMKPPGNITKHIYFSHVQFHLGVSYGTPLILAGLSHISGSQNVVGYSRLAFAG